MECYTYSMSRIDILQKKLGQVVQKQQHLLQGLAILVANPGANAVALDRIQRQLNRLRAQQEQLISELALRQLEAPEAYGAYGRQAGQRPMREQVLDTLEEITVPASPRAISEFAAARFGLALPPDRFASLRRDEERAFRKDPTSRPAWVVPAINLAGLTAIPRLVASSAWEPERRLIGSRTLRTNHLRTLLAILRCYEEAQTRRDSKAGLQLRAMARSYAETVPGALPPGEELDVDGIRNLAKAELERINPVDFEERSAAAQRLQALAERYRLWGKPVLLEGKAASRR
jgi:hypothetical protein